MSTMINGLVRADPRGVAPTTPRRAHLGACVVVGALLTVALTACGETTAGSPSAAAPVDVSSVPTAAATADPAPAGCTPTPAVVAATTSFPEVTGLRVDGGCGQVLVETSLPPGALGDPSAAKAIDICNAVSKVAYVGSIYGVSVVGQDRHELAASVNPSSGCV